MKKILPLLFVSSFIVSCGGGGGESEGNENGNNSNIVHDLSKAPALNDLFVNIQNELDKGEFEKTTDYETRLNNYVLSLTDYVVSAKVLTTYDADAEELYIYTLPYSFGEGEKDNETAFYDGYTEVSFQNVSDLYSTVSREAQNAFTGEYFTRYYYNIISVSPSEAEKIIDGFMVEYTLDFNFLQVLASDNYCISAYYTQCTNHVFANVVSYKVYNTVNKQEYY